MDVVPSSIGNYSVPLGETHGGLCCRMLTQDFKIRERCLEEMAAEDRLSRLFERQHKFAARYVAE